MKCILQNKNENKIKYKIKHIFQNKDLKTKSISVFSVRALEMGLTKFSAALIPPKYILFLV